MIEKAFYSGFRLHPGEIGYVLVPRLVSVWVSALCKLKHSSPGIPDLFVEKKERENLEEKWGGKEFSAGSQFPECSRRGYIDWIPLLLLQILVDWSLVETTCLVPLVQIHDSWGNNIFLEASGPFSFPAYRHNKELESFLIKTIQQTLKCLLCARNSAVHKSKVPVHVELMF